MKSVAAKGSVLLFLLYTMWYKEAFGDFLPGLYGGAALIVITTLLYVDHKPLKAIIPPNGIIWGVGFGIYSLVSGIVVASNRGLLVSSIVTYMAFMIICWCICIICHGENDIHWLLKCITIVCYVCAVYTVVFGKASGNSINGMNAITMSSENNPNALGMLMVFGTFSVLYDKKHKFGELIWMLGSVLLFCYVIILTGSRKSLVSAGLLCFGWLVSFVRDTHNLNNKNEKRIRYGVLMVALAIGITYFIKEYVNTVSFAKMLRLGSDGSTLKRMEMYREGVEFFKSSKLFGVGYNQYRVKSAFNTYAHSTYAEVLADGGFFGCLLYFYPIIKTGVILVKKLKTKLSYQQAMLLALYAVEMLLGVGVIFMYSFGHLLMWSILYMTAETEYLSEVTDDSRGEMLCLKSKRFLGF